MFKSSKKEGNTHNNASHNTIQKFKKLFILKSFISRLFCKAKSENSLGDIMTQLKSNKMTLDEQNIFTNLLKFGHKTVEDIMIPRSDIVAVKLTTSLEELSQMMMCEIPHSRTLVYDNSLDNIVGFIHIKDLFKVVVTKQDFELQNIMRKPIISVSSMKLIDLLAKMRRDRTHISIIVDEYGGTDGIVTIENIIAAIVGRIDDEHDEKSDNDSFSILSNNVILANARVRVADLETVLGVKLKGDDDEFETIGGLILAKVGNMPAIGTKIDILEKVTLEVIDANPRVLKKVKLYLK